MNENEEITADDASNLNILEKDIRKWQTSTLSDYWI